MRDTLLLVAMAAAWDTLLLVAMAAAWFSGVAIGRAFGPMLWRRRRRR